MTGKHLQYLLEVLNNLIVGNIFKRIYVGGGLGKNGYRYKKQFLENLPIPLPNQNNSYTIIQLLQLNIDEFRFIESQ